jgi:hypothetical protein
MRMRYLSRDRKAFFPGPNTFPSGKPLDVGGMAAFAKVEHRHKREK